MKEIEIEIQTWPKFKELIKSKDFIKLLTCLINLFKDLIEEELSLKVNWTKIRRIN
jgi:hypothetical protein